MTLFIILYGIAALWLAVYAFNAYALTGLYLKNRHQPLALADPSTLTTENLPHVTVQLPIFNEALVVERLIEGIIRLEYPRDRLHIQVLDDSTDQTTELAKSLVGMYQQAGFNIELRHRHDRTGFKAGALAEGLETVTSDYIALFDSDFVPHPDFLLQTIPHLMQNPDIGFVQTRWGHLNRDYSMLTAAQALAIDGHFTIEQTARNRAGLLMNFNGTGGVWRRSCIEASGGWQYDTLCEDFDLSYRAQLQGWHVLYLPEVVAPAEIPPQIAAFKRQQFRWAKGSIQCLRKLGQPVLRSNYPWWAKLQSMIHLSNYLVHPLMVLITLLIPIIIVNGTPEYISGPLLYLSLGSLGPPLMYLVAQRTLHPDRWKRHYKAMLPLALIGGGVALSNTKAVVEGWFNIGHMFRRTPKFNVAQASDRWQTSSYRLPVDWLVIGELGLSLYAFWGAYLAATHGQPFAVPFILLYAFSFGYVGGQGLWDARYDLRAWLKAHLAPEKPQPVRKNSRGVHVR